MKTVAGFLNTDGGTLFVGVNDQREPIGLAHDAALVKPPNGDGLVNWLTTHLIRALKHTAVMRTRRRRGSKPSVASRSAEWTSRSRRTR